MSGKETSTQSVAMPSYLGALSAGTALADAFFFDCMKMSSAKDISSALNRRS